MLRNINLLLHFFSFPLGSTLFSLLFCLFSLCFSIYSNNRTNFSPLQLWTPAFFLFCLNFFLHSSLLIRPVASSPSPPSATWTQQVSSPPDFAPTRPWKKTESPNTFCFEMKKQLPHSPLSESAEQWIHPALLNTTTTSSVTAVDHVAADLAAVKTAAVLLLSAAELQTGLWLQSWSSADRRTTWSNEAWLDCLCF